MSKNLYAAFTAAALTLSVGAYALPALAQSMDETQSAAGTIVAVNKSGHTVKLDNNVTYSIKTQLDMSELKVGQSATVYYLGTAGNEVTKIVTSNPTRIVQ